MWSVAIVASFSLDGHLIWCHLYIGIYYTTTTMVIGIGTMTCGYISRYFLVCRNSYECMRFWQGIVLASTMD